MADNFKRLGVFATTDETKHALRLYSTPLLFVERRDGSGLSGPREPWEEVHRLALEHGLPEIEGHYGLDLQTGEFISL